MARWILLLIAATALEAQTHVALSSRTGVTADKLTLQHDPTNQTRIQACAVVIQSASAGTVTTQVSGTAASTTEVTPAATSPGGSAAKAKAYSNSNVGSGTTTSAAMRFSANIPFTLSLKNVRISGNGTTKNITAVLALDGSADVVTAIYWAEDGTCAN